jgi:hypothetical protein
VRNSEGEGMKECAGGKRRGDGKIKRVYSENSEEKETKKRIVVYMHHQCN